MKRALLVLALLLSGTLVAFAQRVPQGALAQTSTCDCQVGLEHLCRCGVWIDQKTAEQQFSYLNRLLLAEFKELLSEAPVSSVRVGKLSEMSLNGEAAQGFIDDQQIVISPQLKRGESLMVLAHELGHAWQFSCRQDINKVQDFLVEGFAEWVAYHLVKRAGLTEFSHRIKTNPDPLYGKAFRWFRKLELEHGRDTVLAIMLNWVDVDGHK